MTSKTAILIAAVGSLFALAGPVLAADDANTEKFTESRKRPRTTVPALLTRAPGRPPRTAAARSSSSCRRAPASAWSAVA